MNMELFDTSVKSIESVGFSERIGRLHSELKSSISPSEGTYQAIEPDYDEAISQILELDDPSLVNSLRPSLIDSTKQMLYGIEKNGIKTLGLEKLSTYKVNPEYQIQNLKQQAGFAAEIISTNKENLIAKATGNELTTYRADDLPELFAKNDQYVDKVRIDAKGNIVDRIQTKFVGANGDEWVSKMMSKDFDKYFSDGKINKIECPKNFYDDALKSIANRKADLQQQLERVTNDGKIEVANKIQRKLNKLDQLESMTEKSTVTTDEAMYARLHPKAYSAQLFAKEVAKTAATYGLKSAAIAAGLTCIASTVEDVSLCINGELTAMEATLDVLEDTAKAGALGFATVFVSTAVAETMKTSSSHLISTVGGSCLPAAAISFAVESCDDVINYAQGNIDGSELATKLVGNAAIIAGALGGAKLGGMAGAAIGPAGLAIGGAAGAIIGGTIGCIATTEMYATVSPYVNEAFDVAGEKISEAASLVADKAVDAANFVADMTVDAANFIADKAVDTVSLLADKAVEYANSTIAAVSEFVPEATETVKTAFTEFLASVGINIT